MLSIEKLGSNLDYYLELATAEYYLSGGEPPGRWYGQGAARLGLSGVVDHQTLRHLAAGYARDGEKKLVQNAGKEKHQVGWDLTFSAPKSVSVLWSVAPDDIRQTIQHCHEAAVCKAIDFVEQKFSHSRTGKGGKGQVKVGLAVGLFEHGTSRANDPQLHTHALVLNLGLAPDAITRSILSRPLFRAKMVTGALYRLELAHQLVKQLGLRLVSKGFGFEVKGVPQALCDDQSKRRQQIEEALAAFGSSSAHASHIATLETRSRKETKPRADLFESWQQDAKSFGFTPASIRNLIGRQPIRQTPVVAIQSAIRGLATQHSYFSRNEILREAAVLTQHQGVSVDRLITALDGFLKSSPDVVSLPEDCFSTRKNVELERDMLGMVKEMLEDHSHVVGIDRVEKRLVKDAAQGPDKCLSWEQAAAVAHITMAPGAVQVVAGKAGVGKTQMLKVAAELWQASGFKVYGACISGKAARGLETETGIRSETIAKLIYDASQNWKTRTRHHGRQLFRALRGKKTFGMKPAFKLDSRTVLVLDEAAMIGTQDLHLLLKEVKRAGAKIVLIGDAFQLQPIAAGTPFRALAKKFGAVHIDQIRRQRDAFDRQVVIDLSEGRADDAIRSLYERGFVHIADDRRLAIEKLVADWAATGERTDPIFVPTRKEAAEINQRCQKFRVQNDEIWHWKSVKVNGQKFHIGDRIIFEARDKRLRVENGDFATITKINTRDKLIAVKLDSGKTVMVPLKRYSNFSLGYAMTVHKGQGATVENAFVLLGGSMQDRFLSYVQMSRARGQTRVYLDRFEADEAFKGIIYQMNRSDLRPLAVELKDENKHSLQYPSWSP